MTTEEARIHAILASGDNGREWGSLNEADIEAIRWLYGYACRMKEEKEKLETENRRLVRCYYDTIRELRQRIAGLSEYVIETMLRGIEPGDAVLAAAGGEVPRGDG